jgi:hypothetical protein
VLAEYFGWAEILRRETQFLNMGDVERTRQVRKALDAVSEALLTNKIEGSAFRVFRGEQRAIGEIMMAPPQQRGDEPRRRNETIGYATFVKQLADPSFERWFTDLRTTIVDLASSPTVRVERLPLIQHALLDLFDTLDPDHVRVDTHLLKKLPATDLPGHSS